MSGFALSVLLAVPWLPLFLFRAEETSKALGSYRFWERVWVLASPTIVAAHVALSSAVLSFTERTPPLRAAASLVLCVAGVGFDLWARRVIGPLRVRRLPDDPPTRLRRDGPFAVVRNPLYLGTLLAAAAPALAAGQPHLVFTYLFCVLALFVRSVQEERRLHEQLGEEYASYCREVKRLVPFVW
jgi:protein-S-isoprenylcysteine O-methyltransferase Ste14